MPGKTETPRAGDAAPERRGVYLLTVPRSASNLFTTMMAKQPGYQNSEYKLSGNPLITLSQLEKGRLSERPEDERKALYDEFRTRFGDLQDEVDDAHRNGKQPFIKEHALFLYGPDKLFINILGDNEVEPLDLQQRDGPKSPHTNPTSLPDRFLLSLQPIFQTRHPALMFPSMLRTQRTAMPHDNTDMCNPRVYGAMTLRHSRAIYEWYLENAGKMKPRVIDAEDVINDPAAVRQLCVDTGLDPDAVQYEWEVRHEEHPQRAHFVAAIYASTGIIKGLHTSNLDMEAEKVKWKAEFGEEDGEMMAKVVRDAMPDYQYLLSQRSRA